MIKFNIIHSKIILAALLVVGGVNASIYPGPNSQTSFQDNNLAAKELVGFARMVLQYKGVWGKYKERDTRGPITRGDIIQSELEIAESLEGFICPTETSLASLFQDKAIKKEFINSAGQRIVYTPLSPNINLMRCLAQGILDTYRFEITDPNLKSKLDKCAECKEFCYYNSDGKECQGKNDSLPLFSTLLGKIYDQVCDVIRQTPLPEESDTSMQELLNTLNKLPKDTKQGIIDAIQFSREKEQEKLTREREQIRQTTQPSTPINRDIYMAKHYMTYLVESLKVWDKYKSSTEVLNEVTIQELDKYLEGLTGFPNNRLIFNTVRNNHYYGESLAQVVQGALLERFYDIALKCERAYPSSSPLNQILSNFREFYRRTSTHSTNEFSNVMGKMSANILNILEHNLETGTLYTLNQQEIKTLITQLGEFYSPHHS